MEAAEAVTDILEHYGTKGMKWGVRRKRPSAVTVTQKGKKLRTKGGFRRPASPDAIRTAKIGQVGRASGLKALSNDELNAYSKRLNLEANVNRLEYGQKNAAQKFVASVLGQAGKSAIQDAANQEASNQVKKRLAKKSAQLVLFSAL